MSNFEDMSSSDRNKLIDFRDLSMDEAIRPVYQGFVRHGNIEHLNKSELTFELRANDALLEMLKQGITQAKEQIQLLETMKTNILIRETKLRIRINRLVGLEQERLKQTFGWKDQMIARRKSKRIQLKNDKKKGYLYL